MNAFEAVLATQPTAEATALIKDSLPLLFNLLGALAVFVLGWIIAGLLAKITRSLLRRTNLDEKLSLAVTGEKPGPRFRLDRWIGTVVFWVVLLLALVAALNVLNLTTVSEPLNQFLNKVFAFLPQALGAAVIAAIAWIVATLAKTALLRGTRNFSLDEKLFGKDEPDAPRAVVVGETVAQVVFWFVLLFFLPLILNALNLGAQLSPLLNLLDGFLAALPRILKATIIAAAGWLIARIVKLITANLLQSTGVDKVGAQFGLDAEKGGQPLSALVGTLVFILILIPTATASLEALQIPAISRPATAMLEQVTVALPRIFTAVVIVAAGVIFGGFVGSFLSKTLAGLGFDRVFTQFRMPSASTASVNPESSGGAQQPTPAPVRTPSDILGVVAQVGIALFATVAATNILDLPALTEVVRGLLLLFGQVISGVAVFAVGLYLANLSHQLVISSGGNQMGLVAQAARIAILIFSGAMALQQIGIAPNIVMLAFGLLLGSLAVAIALAFGLGGQQVAAEQLREWRQQLRRD